MSAMISANILEQISAAVRSVFPAGVGKEAENNLRAALAAALARLDLVTREEFEVQQAVLARTRVLLEQLEKQVAELEARLEKK
jgi:hypothetical protein